MIVKFFSFTNTPAAFVKHHVLHTNTIHELTFQQFYQDYREYVGRRLRKKYRHNKAVEYNVKQILQELHEEQVGLMVKFHREIPKEVLQEYQFHPKLFRKIRHYLNKKGINLEA